MYSETHRKLNKCTLWAECRVLRVVC
jgi:hypothetical protein